MPSTEAAQLEIHKGKRKKPRRVLIYGQGGVGKSTWASQAPLPLFLCCEDGIDDLSVDSLPSDGAYKDWPHFYQDLGQLCKHWRDYNYKTLVIDSLDWLEKLIWADVCQDHGLSDITEFSYGKGYGLANQLWRKLIACLDHLRQNGCMVILIAHQKIERFESPDVDSYDRYTIALHKGASALVMEWSDEILFANFKVEAKETGDGLHKRRKGVGGERYILTRNKPTAVAKSRVVMRQEIDMQFSTYLKALEGND